MTCYLDYNATVPIKPGVIEAMVEAMRHGGNPSSSHQAGRAARAMVDEARATVADLVGAAPGAVVFTSGGTEANNQALRGSPGRILVSAIEHDSVLAAAPDAVRAPVQGDGQVDLAALEALLASSACGMVSVMLANNETGVLQPVAEISRLARRHGALVHCDAIQAAGKVPADLAALGVDFLSLSAHKFGGPPGVGALILAPGIEPVALLQGGGQERRWRSGTENLPGIVGFGRACALASGDDTTASRLRPLRDRLEAEIQALQPAAVVLGQAAARLPNTSCLTMPGVASQTQLIHFDLAGIAISAGSACSSGKIGGSHVLMAMGVEPDVASSAIRVSAGWGSEAADIDRFVAAWTDLHDRHHQRRQAVAACN